VAAADALDVEGQLPPRHHRAGRSISMPDALALIPDGARVYVASFMGTPTTLLEAMAEDSGRWTSIETASDYAVEPLATFAQPNKPFRHLTVQASTALDGMREAGALRTIPACSSQFGGLFMPRGAVAS